MGVWGRGGVGVWVHGGMGAWACGGGVRASDETAGRPAQLHPQLLHLAQDGLLVGGQHHPEGIQVSGGEAGHPLHAEHAGALEGGRILRQPGGGQPLRYAVHSEQAHVDRRPAAHTTHTDTPSTPNRLM